MAPERNQLPQSPPRRPGNGALFTVVEQKIGGGKLIEFPGARERRVREISFYDRQGILVATHIHSDSTPRGDLRRALVGVTVEAAVSAALDDPYPALEAYYDSVGKGIPTSHNYTINGVPGVARWTPGPHGLVSHEGHTLIAPRDEYTYRINVTADGRWVDPRGLDGGPVPLCREGFICDLINRQTVDVFSVAVDPNQWCCLQRSIVRAMRLGLPSAAVLRPVEDGAHRFMEFMPAPAGGLECRVTIAS